MAPSRPPRNPRGRLPCTRFGNADRQPPSVDGAGERARAGDSARCADRNERLGRDGGAVGPQAKNVETHMTTIAPPQIPELLRARLCAIAKIIAEVARAHNMTPAMLVGDQRARLVVAVRHFAYWRAARET